MLFCGCLHSKTACGNACLFFSRLKADVRKLRKAVEVLLNRTHTHPHNHFTALFRDHWLSRYQKKIFFWTFLVQGDITEADTPTIWQSATPSGLISNPPPSSPIFTLDVFPAVTLPLSWLGTGTKYAFLHTQWRGSMPLPLNRTELQ